MSARQSRNSGIKGRGQTKCERTSSKL